MSYYLMELTFEVSFQTTTSSRPDMRAGAERICLISLPFAYVYWYTYNFAPRRVSSLHGRDGHHSTAPQTEVARQLPGDIPRGPRPVAK